MRIRSLLCLTVTVLAIGCNAPAQRSLGSARHLDIALPQGVEIRNNGFYFEIALSPDGRYVVYVDRAHSPVRLLRRDLGDGTTVPMPGVERGASPFFSADGRWLAFVARGRLWKVPVEGGEPVDLVPIENFFGGAWGPDGTIVYVPEPGGGLYKVSADGGQPERLTDQGWYPSFLPDGHSVLFNSFDSVANGVAILDLRSGEIEELPLTGRAPRFVRSGHLLLGDGNDLAAVAFDPVERRLIGEARVLLPDVGNGRWLALQFDVSQDGTLVYITGGKARQSELVRVGLDGTVSPIGSEPRNYLKPRLSPDGSQVAFEVQEAGRSNVWVADATGGNSRQLTSESDTTMLDWMPDGRSLLTHQRQKTSGALYSLPADGSGEGSVLFSGQAAGLDWVFADGATPDGSRIVGRVPSEGGGNGDIAMLAIDGSGAFEVMARSSQAGVEHHTGTVSPDGRWLAFVTDKSGNREVYVQPLDGGGSERLVSGQASGWAQYPHWSPDSRSIYYVQGNQMRRADVGATAEQPVTHKALFELGGGLVWASGNYTLANFDLAPGGEWFLMPRTVGEFVAPSQISVLTNLAAAIDVAFAEEVRGTSREHTP